jgi:hypothetical protein
VATKAITYALGKDCVLRVDGRQLDGVADVVLRESCTTIDVTTSRSRASSSVVVTRSLELGFAVPDLELARWLFSKRYVMVGFSLVPQLLLVEFEGGLLVELPEGCYFTIHDVDFDEPIDGAVIPRFQLREWDKAAGVKDSDDTAPEES